MRKTSVVAAVVAGLWSGLGPGFGTRAAHAEPRPASRGFYAEGAVGATAFLGEAANYSKVGPAVGARLGYDLFSWVGVGISVGASTHEATVPPPPEGEFYQLYTGSADVRLGLNVARFGLFAQGGIGVGMLSSNVLERSGLIEPGRRLSLALLGGGGVEYQFQNRHYALGLTGAWSGYTDFGSSSALTVQASLRYTY